MLCLNDVYKLVLDKKPFAGILLMNHILQNKSLPKINLVRVISVKLILLLTTVLSFNVKELEAQIEITKSIVASAIYLFEPTTPEYKFIYDRLNYILLKASLPTPGETGLAITRLEFGQIDLLKEDTTISV